MKAILYSLKNDGLLALILLVICVGIVGLSGLFGNAIGVLVIGLIIFVSAFYISYKFPRHNIFFLLACSFLLPFLIKAFGLFDLPVGNALQALFLIILLTLSLNGRIGGIKTFPGILLSAWTIFLILELANPIASSRIAGLAALRGLMPLICSFFIAYSSIESKKDAYLFFGGWFVLSLLAGLYGLYQEFAGLPSFDFAWASFDPTLYGALFTWGRLRKFSFFFSPSEFGMIMSLASIAALIVCIYVKKTGLRVLSGITSFICAWSMMYTGSRTAMIMLPVGAIILAAISLDRKVLILVGVMIVGGAAMVLRPGASGALYVMSTAFSGTNDPSMNVRIRNQAIIRSYIRENPIGFGLGSNSYLGMKYSPHTFVGSFPPDSEYVKIAIETGWFGLLLFCTMMALFFGYGVRIYFRTRDPDWKIIMLVCLVVFFMMIVGLYPQEVFFISQVMSIIMLAVVGLMAKIHFKLNRTAKQGNNTDESEEEDENS
jgi:putative inorganic carbon (hco3(-)) transporter